MVGILRACGILLTISILFNCSSPKMISRVASDNFRIDGDRREWKGRFEIPKDEHFAIGIGHSKNYLYIAISSLDRGFERQLAMHGITLWVDSRGGKRENLGIRFGSHFSKEGGRSSKIDQRQSSHRGDNQYFMEQGGGFLKGDLDLIVLNNEGRERMGPADLLASAAAVDDGLFIEYQIPFILLGENFDMTQILGLGLDSQMERSEEFSEGRGGRGSGSRVGMEMADRMNSQGRGGRRPGRQADGMDQNDVDVWFKIQLNPR
ncbi:hypothetical protein HQ531_14400 [bacterium]|nr:hypothetical protein [bacterium]